MEGKLPVGWRWRKLEDLAKFVYGCPFESSKFNSDGNGLPIIRIRNLISCATEMYYDGYYDENYIVNNDEILVGMDGEFNIVKWNGGKALLNQRICKLEFSSTEIIPDFAYRALVKILKQIEDKTPQVTVKHLSAKQMKDIQIPLPPRETQRRIVAILDKAEETRRLRAQADELAEKLPFSIFVEMFGDPMQNIKGWKMVTPTDIASDDKNAITIGPFGSDLMAKDYRSHGVPLIFVKNIRENKFRGNGIRFIDESKGEELKSHRVNPRDILMTKMGDPPGDVALYPENSQPGIITADCIKLTLNPRIANASYILWVFRTDYVRNQVIRSTKGAAQQKINLSTFKSIKFPLPEIELQNQFSEKVNQVEEIRNLQALSNPQIEDLLASLMQKAFVGDLVL
ncbi:MAG: restriction endonuclease subunit S [Methanothrix sp.]